MTSHLSSVIRRPSSVIFLTLFLCLLSSVICHPSSLLSDLGRLTIIREGTQFRCYSQPMSNRFAWFEWSHDLTNWTGAPNETIYLADGIHMTQTSITGYHAIYIRLRSLTNR